MNTHCLGYHEYRHSQPLKRKVRMWRLWKTKHLSFGERNRNILCRELFVDRERDSKTRTNNKERVPSLVPSIKSPFHFHFFRVYKINEFEASNSDESRTLNYLETIC